MATTSSNSNNVYLHQQLQRAADVVLFDEMHGVFGELTEPNIVLSALQNFERSSSLEGKLDDPSAAKIATVLRSLSCEGQNNKNDICMELDNLSSQTLKVRWMDEHGQNDPRQFLWTIAPSSSWVQWAQAGHLMLISVDMGSEEFVLGTYRPWKRLPSGSPHCLLVEGRQEPDLPSSALFLETVVTEKQDAILVAAAALDPVEVGGGDASTKTLAFLSTIVGNLAKHPEEQKYRSLRLSNPKIQQYIVSSWGAMHMLHVIGFRQDFNNDDGEAYLLISPPSNNNNIINPQVLHQAQKWLEVLQGRASKNFVAELALSVPWQRPVVVQGGGGSQNWSRSGRGTSFVTAEERWARAERNNARRASGAARRPNPGEAPSSRGKWGR